MGLKLRYLNKTLDFLPNHSKKFHFIYSNKLQLQLALFVLCIHNSYSDEMILQLHLLFINWKNPGKIVLYSSFIQFTYKGMGMDVLDVLFTIVYNWKVLWCFLCSILKENQILLRDTPSMYNIMQERKNERKNLFRSNLSLDTRDLLIPV